MKRLTLEELSISEDTHASLEELALSFDGYAHFPGPTLFQVAERTEQLRRTNRLSEASEEELRGALFVLQRSKRHVGEALRVRDAVDILEELKRRLRAAGRSDDPGLHR